MLPGSATCTTRLSRALSGQFSCRRRWLGSATHLASRQARAWGRRRRMGGRGVWGEAAVNAVMADGAGEEL